MNEIYDRCTIANHIIPSGWMDVTATLIHQLEAWRQEEDVSQVYALFCFGIMQASSCIYVSIING